METCETPTQEKWLNMEKQLETPLTAEAVSALKRWAETLDYKPKRFTIRGRHALVYFEGETYHVPRPHLAKIHPDFLTSRFDGLSIEF